MPSETDILRAFVRIEEILISSMVRNFKRHRVRQIEEGKEWSQWQLEQLRSLEKYRRENLRKHGREFNKLNEQIGELVELSYREAEEEELQRVSDAQGLGWQGEFLKAPEERLDALIEAVDSDMQKAEHAILRKAEDEYRKTIFNAVLYAQSGAGTYEQAIDMATHDFLAKGIDGIVYKSRKTGKPHSRHGIREYAQMAIRTATKRAALVAEGAMRESWGVHTVYVDYRDEACPLCLEWVGEVLVDDVYSGGTVEEARAQGYATLSEAMEAGLFHPNCKDTLSTYFPGITEQPRRLDEAEVIMTETAYEAEQIRNAYKNRLRSLGRLEEYSLAPENKEKWGRLKAKVKDKLFASSLRKSPSYILSDSEIEEIKARAERLGIPAELLSFNTGAATSLDGITGLINIRGDIYPDTTSSRNRDTMSIEAVLAHEYYGHKMYEDTVLLPGDWRDEFRASYRAAIDTPNLTAKERASLMIDAYERAGDAGVVLPYTDEYVIIVYGYERE